MFIIPKKRVSDCHGSGHFGASRGSRTHNGVDLCVDPETLVFSHIDGVVTKLGYPYSDDLSFRYVQVSDIDNRQHRFFYVEPMVNIGDSIEVGYCLGDSQKLGDRYENITEHVHYEVKLNGHYLDPNDFL